MKKQKISKKIVLISLVVIFTFAFILYSGLLSSGIKLFGTYSYENENMGIKIKTTYKFIGKRVIHTRKMSGYMTSNVKESGTYEIIADGETQKIKFTYTKSPYAPSVGGLNSYLESTSDFSLDKSAGTITIDSTAYQKSNSVIIVILIVILIMVVVIVSVIYIKKKSRKIDNKDDLVQ